MEKAVALAKRLHLNHVPLVNLTDHNAILVYTEKGLQIQLKQNKNNKSHVTLHVDFLSDSLNYRRQHGGGIKQALARAVGVKPGKRPSILDVTAGLGKDSFLLASLGCKVRMIERSLILGALLYDGLERAEKSQYFKEIINSKLTLSQGDAIAIMNTDCHKIYDTIYLDPMYPHSGKSALNKQEMRIIRKLVGDDDDSDKLLDTALISAKKRAVVKRPKGAPLLNSVSPTHTIKMKNSRYDVYMI
jgi:16S rRNA (guanine1516-N2)-methyltransferase